MDVRLHIERLTLDGLAITPAERAGVAAALEAELGRLIARDGVASGGGIAVPALIAPAIVAASPFDAAAFGRALAGALHAGIGGPAR